MGTYVARREVALKSEGQYIFEFDPDDIISPHLCQIDYEVASRTGADIVTHEVFNFHEESELKNVPAFDPTKNYTVYWKDTNISNLYLNWKLSCDFKSKLIKRSVFIEAFNLIDQNLKSNYILYAEDRLIAGGLYLKARTLILLPNYLYYYRLKKKDGSYERAVRKGIYRQLKIVNQRLNELYGTNRVWTN